MIVKKLHERVRLGPYQVIAKIGEGGMGTVYLTKWDGPVGFNKLAVVKELRLDLAGSRPLVDMFLNEVRLAARLTHPNVVHTYGANEEDGSLYFAMEYLDGQPWSRIRRAMWRSGALPFRLHVKVLAEVLAGLHYAHELRDYDGSALGVVHCDVSPQNVFVTYDGQVKVVDFGVACAVNDDRRTGTSNVVVGKLGYIAPEQARGDALDRRADVFAVGVMLWELIAGKRFVQGDDHRALRAQRILGAEPRIREVVPEAQPVLADICDKAMAIDPNDRFATAGEFREALLGFLADDVHDLDHAQLGELVIGAFEDERKSMHGLIEQHLSNPPMRTTSTVRPVQSMVFDAPEYTIRADLSELASVSRLHDEDVLRSASNSIRIDRQLPRGPTWAGIGGALLILTLWLWSRPGDPDPGIRSVPLAAASPPAASAPSLPSPAPRAVPQTFELRVSASPPESKLVLDGVPLRGNPYIERRPIDGELHVLRASGPGLQSQERVLAFDRDRTVTFQLTKLPLVAARATRPRKTSAAVSGGARETARRVKRDVGASTPTAKSARRPIYVDDPWR